MADLTDHVRDLLVAFWQGDWDRTMEHFADDAIYEDPLLDEPVRGKQGILDVFKYCHAWGRIEGEIRSLVGDDRLAVAELRIRGTVIGPIDGLPDDVLGRNFDFAEADVFEFDAEGKVRRETIYPDVTRLMRQLGQPIGPGDTGDSHKGRTSVP